MCKVIERCKKGEARRPVRISQFQNKLKVCKSLILQAFLFLYLPKLPQFMQRNLPSILLDIRAYNA